MGEKNLSAASSWLRNLFAREVPMRAAERKYISDNIP